MKKKTHTIAAAPKDRSLATRLYLDFTRSTEQTALIMSLLVGQAEQRPGRPSVSLRWARAWAFSSMIGALIDTHSRNRIVHSYPKQAEMAHVWGYLGAPFGQVKRYEKEAAELELVISPVDGLHDLFEGRGGAMSILAGGPPGTFCRPGDTIVISPKARWFWGSNYSYVMTNKELGTAIDGNLLLGPVAFGVYSTWIVGIDYNLGQVYLLNGQGERTVWEISNVDLYLFKDWEVNDTLIMGLNDSWFCWLSSYNHIVVNVNMNHTVRARQISSTPNYRPEATA